jgi:glycosyltransferase involved in cell wall biosynthesis
MVAAEELATPGAHVVLNIPNPDDFDGSGNHLEIIQAVYVGDVTAERGALEIADLARRLPGIHFLVIGRADPDLFREMTSRSGNSPNLEIVGRLEHKDAWERARGSIAGLSLLRPLPAYSEAIATKLWEYAAAGIPPVVTDLPGQNRFVSAVDSSLAGQSLDDLAGIIQRLAEDEEFRARVTETARAVVVEHWLDSRPDLAVVRAVSLAQS